MDSLNYYNNNTYSKEELMRQDLFIKRMIDNLLISSKQLGIVAHRDNTTGLIGNDLLVGVGTNPDGGGNDTIKIEAGYAALLAGTPTVADNNIIDKTTVGMVDYLGEDNFEITHFGAGVERIVFLHPEYQTYEVGTVTVTAIGNSLAGAGTTFTESLRAQSTKAPVKIRFSNPAGGLLNTGEYEVITVSNDAVAIISGSLLNESGLRMHVIGSFDLGQLSSLSGKYLYQFNRGQIIMSTDALIPSPALFAAIPLARVTFDGIGGFALTDLRQQYLHTGENGLVTEWSTISNAALTFDPTIETNGLNVGLPAGNPTVIKYRELGDGTVEIIGKVYFTSPIITTNFNISGVIVDLLSDDLYFHYVTEAASFEDGDTSFDNTNDVTKVLSEWRSSTNVFRLYFKHNVTGVYDSFRPNIFYIKSPLGNPLNIS